MQEPVNADTLRMFMNNRAEFKRAYLSGTSMLIVNCVRRSREPISSIEVARELKIKMSHTCTVLTRMVTLGYLTRYKQMGIGDDFEYRYEYAL